MTRFPLLPTELDLTTAGTERKRRRFASVANPWKLTASEWAIMTRLLEDLTYTQLAEELCLQRRTIMTYILRAKRKMNVATTRHAVLLVDRHLRSQTT